jgi:hypothetical protein
MSWDDTLWRVPADAMLGKSKNSMITKISLILLRAFAWSVGSTHATVLRQLPHWRNWPDGLRFRADLSHHATGVRVRELPIRIEKLMAREA